MDPSRSLGSWLVITLSALACERHPDAPAAPRVATPSSAPSAEPRSIAQSSLDELAAVPRPPPDMPCDDMSAPQCMRSLRCVLDAPPSPGAPYVCREARGPCEPGLAQGDPGFADACGARPGCVFHVARCVCFPQTRVVFHSANPVPNCFCGGGPPQRCEATDDNPTK